MPMLPVTFDDIAAARQRLAGAAHLTPLMTSTSANAQCETSIFFKCENLQRMGAFKFRGAYNAMARFTNQQKQQGVGTYSSGNHAQAIALAARLHHMRAVIVMPSDAPHIKVAATRGYGAEIITYDRYRDNREEIGLDLAARQGLTLIPPYDHQDVIAGQGTVACEIIDALGSIDVLVAPLGGGGLLSGCAVAARTLSPSCRIIGVEPHAGNDGQQSLNADRIVHIDTPKTIADGAQTQHLGQLTFAIMRELVDEVVTVTDVELVTAMRFFFERMKLVVEPTGCLGAAALLSGKLDVRGQRVAVVLSGGNIDLGRYAELALAP